MTTLREFLEGITKHWDRLPIRVYQDGKWQSLFLSEIEDGNVILDWVKEQKGWMWDDQ